MRDLGDCVCGHTCFDHDIVLTWSGDPSDYASEDWQEFAACMSDGCPCKKFQLKIEETGE